MPPQPSGNGSQFAGDDSTRVLAPVGKGRVLLPVYEPGRAPVNLDGRFLLREYRLPDQTAVIPVTPAQPGADWDRQELPDCKKKATAMGVLFGAGVLFGVPLGMVLLFAILMAKVAM